MIDRHKEDKKQLERFRKAANSVDADKSDDALDRIMENLDLAKKPDADDKKGD